MKALVLLALAVLSGPLAADEVWVLQSGPSAAAAIPLVPVQPVPAWRGLYTDGADEITVYVTSSPQFFPPAVPEVRKTGTPWWVAVFFPSAWKAAQKSLWLDRWVADFQALATLPSPGWPVLFPSVLRKG